MHITSVSFLQRFLTPMTEFCVKILKPKGEICLLWRVEWALRIYTHQIIRYLGIVCVVKSTMKDESKKLKMLYNVINFRR